MIFQELFLLIGFSVLPILFMAPSIVFFIIFLREYIQTKQRMFAYLSILFISFLFKNIFQTGSYIAQNLNAAITAFLLSQAIEMLSLLLMIVVLEMFDKSRILTFRQLILTIFVFTAIGGMISNPLLEIGVVDTRYLINFQPFTSIVLIKMIFNIIGSIWLIIMVIESYKSAWSQKQKGLLKWLFVGLLISMVLPSISYVFEQFRGAAIFEPLGFGFFQGVFYSIGLVIIGIGFLKVSKNPWLLQRQRAHMLMVYSHEGLTLFSRTFSKDITENDMLLLSGAFTAIASLFEEATKTTAPINSINLEGKELKIINHPQFLCALFIDYSTQASELALEKFIGEFENQFAAELESFTGEVSVFNKADQIAQQYFS
jgi:hypothetical protein